METRLRLPSFDVDLEKGEFDSYHEITKIHMNWLTG